MKDGFIYSLDDPDRKTLLDAWPVWHNYGDQVYFWKHSGNSDDPGFREWNKWQINDNKTVSMFEREHIGCLAYKSDGEVIISPTNQNCFKFYMDYQECYAANYDRLKAEADAAAKAAEE